MNIMWILWVWLWHYLICIITIINWVLKQHYQQVQFIPNERRVGRDDRFWDKNMFKTCRITFQSNRRHFSETKLKYISKIAAQTSTDFKMNSDSMVNPDGKRESLWCVKTAPSLDFMQATKKWLCIEVLIYGKLITH